MVFAGLSSFEDDDAGGFRDELAAVPLAVVSSLGFLALDGVVRFLKAVLRGVVGTSAAPVGALRFLLERGGVGSTGSVTPPPTSLASSPGRDRVLIAVMESSQKLSVAVVRSVLRFALCPP